MTHRSSGFVLAPLLWILIALGVLASTALHFTRDTSTSLQVALDRLRLDDVTRSALAFALADMDARQQAATGGAVMQLSDATARIAWTSEAARVDLNLAPPDLLLALFVAAGAETADAQDYSQRVLQRREAARAQGSTLALGFSHPAEVATLALPNRIAQALGDLATVYGTTGLIDPRLAPARLVSSLPGMTEIIRRELASASESELASIKQRESAGVGALFDVAPGRAMRLIVDAQLGTRHRLRSDIVLMRFFDDVEPYRILYWQPAMRLDARGTRGP